MKKKVIGLTLLVGIQVGMVAGAEESRPACPTQFVHDSKDLGTEMSKAVATVKSAFEYGYSTGGMGGLYLYQNILKSNRQRIQNLCAEFTKNWDGLVCETSLVDGTLHTISAADGKAKCDGFRL